MHAWPRATTTTTVIDLISMTSHLSRSIGIIQASIAVVAS
jgi:hypothetical protein